HCSTSAYAKIMAIDRRRSAETCTYAHHRTLSTVVDIEDDGPAHSMQGQVPRHLVVLTADMLDVRTRKGDGGIFLHVKEGSRTQMGITQFIPGIDAGRLHLGIDPGVGRMLLVNIESTTKRMEVPSCGADRHDSYSKRYV